MLIIGNKNEGLASALYKLYPDAEFCSRTTGYDFGKKADMERCAEIAVMHDVIINCSALFRFHQTSLLDIIYKKCQVDKVKPHIINIGSTTDRIKKGGSWLYNAEKKALRDYSNTLSLSGVWGGGPKVTLISLGTLSNKQEKHPDRITINMDEAASYIKWVIDAPRHLQINEISIDPMQSEYWYG
jgi:NADP-dependent 3-hydroxy acid dehydrogenase YdfG